MRQMPPTRRDFLEIAGSAVAGLHGVTTFVPAGKAAQAPSTGISERRPYTGPYCLFSKPLPDMDWARLARAAKQAGFDGLDLTVRPGGHVLPERAAEDRPRAFEAARQAGVGVPMITTGLVSADDPSARPILTTASRLGIRYFKAGYYMYKWVDVRDELAQAGREFRRLADLAGECGMQAGFHNHSEYVGAAVWDAATFVEPLDPNRAGYYFDPRHAVAEGGAGAWKAALRLAASRLKMLAVKDFSWVQRARRWHDVNCPVGEGMVDWRAICDAVCTANFTGPISVHIEYDVPGTTTAEREEHVLAAAARDLGVLKAQFAEACR
jgi:L-ribulose-5-phosphate 3-epimerase